jgi:hypothetical protein
MTKEDVEKVVVEGIRKRPVSFSDQGDSPSPQKKQKLYVIKESQEI